MKKSIYLIFGLFLLLFNSLKAGDPYWWQEHGLNNSNESNDEALATIGQLKHVVDKTIDYLEVALVDNGGAGTEVLALRNQSWFTSTSNSKIVPTIGQLKYAMAPIYDRLREAYPSEYFRYGTSARGLDPAWNTRWMADISPFYSHEELSTALVLPRVPLLGSTPSTGVYSTVSHYPWTEQIEDNEDANLLTLGQLKFACSFETPASFDTGTLTPLTTYSGNKRMFTYTPSDIQESERLPLYIHFSGDSGGGNTPSSLPNWASQGRNRAYVLYFESIGASSLESTFSLKEALIETFIEENQVDTDRIYFSGFSRGGVILMDFLHRRPDLIAVAWFIDPGTPALGLSTNPLKSTAGVGWTSAGATDEQTAFAQNIAQNNVRLILTMAEHRDNGGIVTLSEGLEYYKLFYENNVSILYSCNPWIHGTSANIVGYDRRYHRYISGISKNN